MNPYRPEPVKRCTVLPRADWMKPSSLEAWLISVLNSDAPIYVRDAFDYLEELSGWADADYVILRNACEPDGSDAMVETFGEPWMNRKEIRASMESLWGGEFDRWGVCADVEVLPYFGRCLVLAFVGGIEVTDPERAPGKWTN